MLACIIHVKSTVNGLKSVRQLIHETNFPGHNFLPLLL